MTDNSSVDRLVSKVNREYEAMREGWWRMTPDELIGIAEQIAAAKFIRENLESCVAEDEAEFLLTLKKPLEALIDSVIYRYEPHNIAEREWFSDHLYELMNSHDLDADYEIEEEQSITMQ